jgi:hypothetical protein
VSAAIRFGEIDRPVDDRDGVAADPDVVAVALYKSSSRLGWEVVVVAVDPGVERARTAALRRNACH